jgi:hypothetical protein
MKREGIDVQRHFKGKNQKNTPDKNIMKGAVNDG